MSEAAELGLFIESPAIPRALRPYVRSWAGYVERTSGVCLRRELPSPQVVLIVEFAPPVAVYEGGSEVRSARYNGGFVAGLEDRFSLVEHDGYQAGLQVNLTPLGARRLFNRPLHALSRAVVHVTDLLSREHRSIADRLASAPSWAERFRVMERVLLDGIGRAKVSDSMATTTWAQAQIERGEGASIERLARETGYSRKHLASLFLDHVGMTPKLYASVVRFNRVTARVRAAREPSWGAIAAECGYADQAHLIREVRRFAGVTPSRLPELLHWG